jgi:hypothetical protein
MFNRFAVQFGKPERVERVIDELAQCVERLKRRVRERDEDLRIGSEIKVFDFDVDVSQRCPPHCNNIRAAAGLCGAERP